MQDKTKKIKIISDLSRASGLASGAALGVRTIKENLNREGLISVFDEIRQLINKSLQELENEK
jgi:mevalonate kinase